MTMSGPADTRYVVFLETISTLRPALHRYCARMTGSVTDGEDVVQESLFEAYRNLDRFDEGRPLKPWLFRIAHNRCIDFLRRKGVRGEAEAAAAMPDAVSPPVPATLGVGLRRSAHPSFSKTSSTTRSKRLRSSSTPASAE
jgi:RNA polymerase sigma-70 factor (ECF subfamily)